MGRALPRLLGGSSGSVGALHRRDEGMSAVTNQLRVSRTIRGDPDTLFQVWTDPQKLMHWWRQEGEGWAFAGASVDLRVGGRYRLSMTAPDGKTHVAVGVYREIERPLRLLFTSGSAPQKFRRSTRRESGGTNTNCSNCTNVRKT